LVFFGGETDKEEISSPAVVAHLEEFAATEVEIPAEFLDEITQGRVFLQQKRQPCVLSGLIQPSQSFRIRLCNPIF
jgi:hypothetical protein